MIRAIVHVNINSVKSKSLTLGSFLFLSLPRLVGIFNILLLKLESAFLH